MVLERDFCGVFDTRIAGAHGGGQPGSRHRCGGADFSLATDFRARDGGVALAQPAHRSGNQEVALDALLAVAVALDQVAQDCRHDAGRAIGGRGDDAAARGVFLIHGDGPGADPAHRRFRRGQWRSGQAIGHATRAARHVQAAGQHALGAHAARHAIEHQIGNAADEGDGVVAAMQRGFVGHEQIADWQLLLLSQGKQLLHGAEGVWHLDLGAAGGADEVLIGIDDEAATDRVELALGQQRALPVPEAEAHAVGVQRQFVHEVEDQVAFALEVHLLCAHEDDGLLLLDGLDAAGDAAGIDIIRNLSAQAHEHGTIGAVADAGVGQRTKQLNLHARRLHQQPVRQLQQEAARGAHRADGMRAAGPDTDLEHILQADVHALSFSGSRSACRPRRRPQSAV